MESWDISSLDVAPHRPQVLRSDREARVIAIHLPAGEELQQHQTHERAYLLVVGGQIEVESQLKKGTSFHILLPLVRFGREVIAA